MKTPKSIGRMPNLYSDKIVIVGLPLESYRQINTFAPQLRGLVEMLKESRLDPVLMVGCRGDGSDSDHTRIECCLEGVEWIAVGSPPHTAATKPGSQFGNSDSLLYYLDRSSESVEIEIRARSHIHLRISDSAESQLEFRISALDDPSRYLPLDQFDLKLVPKYSSRFQTSEPLVDELTMLDIWDPALHFKRWAKPLLKNDPKSHLLEVCRARARILGKRFRLLPWLILFAHGCASLLAVYKVVFHPSFTTTLWLLGGETVLVLTAIGLWLRVRVSDLNRHWVFLRSAAELIKTIKGSFGFPDKRLFVPNIVRSNFPNAIDTLSIMACRCYRDEQRPVSEIEFSKRFMKNRIQYQLSYYYDQFCKAKVITSLVTITTWALWIALLISLVCALLVLREGSSHSVSLLLLLLPLLLPIVSGLIVVLPNLLDLRRRITTYRSISIRLDLIGRNLGKLYPDAEASRLLKLGKLCDSHSLLPGNAETSRALRVWCSEYLSWRGRPPRLVDPDISGTVDSAVLGDGWDDIARIVTETNLLTISELIEFGGFIKSLESG